MKCGNCHNDHPSVADVRACYEQARGGTLTLPETERPQAFDSDNFRERMRHNAQQEKVAATERQVTFAKVLLEERYEGDELAIRLESLDGMSKAEASDLISDLKGTERLVPKGQGEGGFPDAAALPAGWYALDTQAGATNMTAFWQVDRPDKGRWAGYVFVSQIIGGREKQRVPVPMQKSVARAIVLAGQDECALRYGREIGQCCRCNRTLTNDESRAKGIGPVCEGMA